MKNSYTKEKNILIAVGVILIFLLGILIWPSGSDDKDLNIKDSENAVLDNQGTLDQQEVVSEAKKEEIKEQNEDSKLNIQRFQPVDEELCEDYLFKQGKTITVASKKITLDKIGEKSVKVSIDGNQIILGAGAYERREGLGLVLQEDNILFFGEDDDDNEVEIRIGCGKAEQPIDKYVQARGKFVCAELVDMCNQQFDFKED